jgi:hypothetical protein
MLPTDFRQNYLIKVQPNFVIINDILLHIFVFMLASQFMCILLMQLSHMYQNQSNILSKQFQWHNISKQKYEKECILKITD